MSRHSALCHDSGVRSCVTNKARCACDRGALPCTTKPGAHDRHASATGMLARQRHECDRGVLSRQTFTEAKKKKTLGIWGVLAWYQSIGIRIPRNDGYGSRSLDSLSSGVAVCTSEHRYVIA